MGNVITQSGEFRAIRIAHVFKQHSYELEVALVKEQLFYFIHDKAGEEGVTEVK